ncbi:WbqC family protein [Gramella sp. AN32]|uniref:WbqC family protein n=1 Tax=Christiangramia antarctica TaxID=2058158 RepID=A0ABW5X6C9_9FLAO|nr:WbqC family protein [Gramella sp. AN32]MCM4154439.1 hypothetical protein [Gramella sp. AN32]
MKPLIIHPTYFGPIVQWVAMINANKVIFENEDNYQKQSYRNRMYIYDSNGKLSLNIPIKHSSSLGREITGKQKYKDVQVENKFNWQLQHWRGLKASYQTSPFFEFFEDELHPLYHTEFKFLMDFNYSCMEFVAESLQLEWEFQKTDAFEKEQFQNKDFRHLVKAKKGIDYQNSKYPQVFAPKLGFIENLSILDLLFNEGNAALQYLENQEKL